MHHVFVDPATELDHGQTVVGGAPPTLIVAITFEGAIAIAIKALSTNTSAVYVGGPSVTTGNGFQLGASESITIDINPGSGPLYINGTAGQGVCWMVIR